MFEVLEEVAFFAALGESDLAVCVAVQNGNFQRSVRLLLGFNHHASQGVMPTSHRLYVLSTYMNIHTFLGVKGHPVEDTSGITASG